MTRVVFGIDPSLAATGVCVALDGKEIETFVIHTDETTPLPARLIELRDRIRGTLSRPVWRAHARWVAMESEVWMRSPEQSKVSGAIHGVLQVLLWEMRSDPFRMISVNPSRVKKWLGAKEKQHVLLQVFKRYGREFEDHNAADAFTLAMIGEAFAEYATSGHLWPELTKPQGEVLDGLLKGGLIWEGPVSVKSKRSRIPRPPRL